MSLPVPNYTLARSVHYPGFSSKMPSMAKMSTVGSMHKILALGNHIAQRRQY